MTMGLLDALNDPVVMAEINKQRALAAKLAVAWSCAESSAMAWLRQEDAAATELFAIGNTVPREILH